MRPIRTRTAPPWAGRSRTTRRRAPSRRCCRNVVLAAGRGASRGSGAATARWSKRGWGSTARRGAGFNWGFAREASTRAVRIVCSARGRGQRSGAGRPRGTGGRPGIWTAPRRRPCARPERPGPAAAQVAPGGPRLTRPRLRRSWRGCSVGCPTSNARRPSTPARRPASPSRTARRRTATARPPLERGQHRAARQRPAPLDVPGQPGSGLWSGSSAIRLSPPQIRASGFHRTRLLPRLSKRYHACESDERNSQGLRLGSQP